jgi:hypothetical protein
VFAPRLHRFAAVGLVETIQTAANRGRILGWLLIARALTIQPADS